MIVEYNSIFGKDRTISVPYDDNFIRTNAHYSNLYFGTSIHSLYQLGIKKGYRFIGCNNAGNNAYFVRKDKLNDIVKEVQLSEGYVESKYRESRNKKGSLSLLSKKEARELLKGISVFNTNLDKMEKF